MSDTEDGEILERIVKITIVGEPATGKSSICARYLGLSRATAATQGAEVFHGQCLSLRSPPSLQICDVAGTALHTQMLDNYLYLSDIVLFVYDVTNLRSFERLRDWIARVKEVSQNEVKKPHLAVFGNKADLEHQRAVRLSDVQKLSSEYFLDCYKGSARTGENIDDTITALVALTLGIQLTKHAARKPAILTRKTQNSNRKPSSDDTEVSGQTLLMNRKAFRMINRKAASSVCQLQ